MSLEEKGREEASTSGGNRVVQQKNYSKRKTVPTYSTHPTTKLQKERKRHFEQWMEKQRKENKARYKKAKTTGKKEDLERWGDEITTHEGWNVGEQNNRFRIAVTNINGIAAIYDWIEWDILVRNMNALQVDCFGVTEPNINFTNKEVEFKFKEITRTFDKHMKIEVAASKQFDTKTLKKKGGIITAVTGRWNGRAKETFRCKFNG